MTRFFTWCDARGLALAELSPIAVATYIEEMHGRYRAPTIKQHLAAIRRLCDWLVIGQVVPANPAASVRGPTHVVRTGKTPVLQPADARLLRSLTLPPPKSDPAIGVFGSHRPRKTPASQRGHFCFALTDDEDAGPVTPSCVTVLHPTMERPEMEPVTTIGIGAVAAYLAKDGIGKLLGPTADYLGEGLRDLTRRRGESIGRIFSNASTKLGSQLDEPGQVPPRVLKTVLNEGSYCEDPVALEYFGGVLASSRTERGRDDRGARVAKVVDNLSTYQLRTHYLIYSSIANLFATSGRRFGTDQDRTQMQIFLPGKGYANAMGFSQEESNNPQIMHHVWHGLTSDGLIEGRWQFGDQRSLRSIFAGAPSDGIVCHPSALGAELFLWALGHGNVPLEHLLSGTLDATIEGLPDGVPGAIAVKT